MVGARPPGGGYPGASSINAGRGGHRLSGFWVVFSFRYVLLCQEVLE